MASTLRLRPVPQCLSCLRSFAAPELPRLATPFQVQTRGKSKKSKLPRTVHVKLLDDIAGYGARGSILAVAPGRMRNKWYPAKKASYVPADRLQKLKHLVVERDASFGLVENATTVDSGTKATVKAAEIQLLSPTRTRELLDTLVPASLDFYRQPIPAGEAASSSATATDSAASSQQLSSQSSSSKIVPDTAITPSPAASPNAAIYGSVSTADILASIKETMALKAAEQANQDAARVVLNPEDIRIVRSEILDVNDVEGESDRVKVLGEFEVELLVKGEESIRRVVKVNATV